MATDPSVMESALIHLRVNNKRDRSWADLPLDKNNLLRSHSLPILPAMVRVITHAISLATIIRILQSSGDKILLMIQRPIVTHRQWHVISFVSDRTPEIDDLVTAFETLFGLFCG